MAPMLPYLLDASGNAPACVSGYRMGSCSFFSVWSVKLEIMSMFIESALLTVFSVGADPCAKHDQRRTSPVGSESGAP